MKKQIRMITYLPYYHLDAAFDNGLRKDYENTRQEDVYKRSLQAAKKGKQQ